MATSQKFPGLMVVPWYDKTEWLSVKESICSLENKKYALERLQFWEQRTPLLPCGVAGTLQLLRIFSYEHMDGIPPEALNELKCMAIMKFLNVCVAGRSKQGEFAKCMKKAGLPEYLIGIRNFAAHTLGEQPGEALLNLALRDCYKFVKKNYWEKQDRYLFDYIYQKEDDAQLHVYCEINCLRHSKNYENLDEIFEKNPSLLQWCRFTKVHFYRHTKVDDYLNQIFIKLHESVNTAKIPSTIFYHCGTERFRDIDRYLLFPRFVENDPNRRLTNKSLNNWRDLVLLYNTPNSLAYLIEDLVKKVIKGNSGNYIASMWLAEIFTNLLQTKNNEETDRLNLNVENIEEVISKLKMFQGSILNQSKPNMIHFMKSFLLLFDFPKDYVDYKVQRVAASSYSVLETPESLKKYEEEIIENLPVIDFSEYLDYTELEPPKDLVEEKLVEFGVWSRADPRMVGYLRRKNGRMNPFCPNENRY